MNNMLSLASLFAQQPGDEAAAAAVGITMILAMCACYGIPILIGLAMTAFWIWMLVDCVSNEPTIPNNNDKLIWILVIALAHGIGAIIYYFARRPKRIAQYGR